MLVFSSTQLPCSPPYHFYLTCFTCRVLIPAVSAIYLSVRRLAGVTACAAKPLIVQPTAQPDAVHRFILSRDLQVAVHLQIIPCQIVLMLPRVGLLPLHTNFFQQGNPRRSQFAIVIVRTFVGILLTGHPLSQGYAIRWYSRCTFRLPFPPKYNLAAS